ncbi:Rz1 lytic protein [Yersinia pseudotuberculosis]
MPPLIPDELTWGDSLALNGELLTVIELCNLDKANIHQIEASRNEP